eukprot:CAMPEP_0206560850 /NCGR_PEP_ID=MMETSP0325_2-20121206/21263_1 /ASSEMBLY_ACC=CAM_ASM_000347 /TAXON_ID=2866 /ORGANISM="Crypthecodinium cohnii, Strain Seligo" /LENGTH=59 /DNA_ID=CAMNT_0054062677 /DNA_START=1029 /DNA_END=1208 /DNA_ORIENTATION=+
MGTVGTNAATKMPGAPARQRAALQPSDDPARPPKENPIALPKGMAARTRAKAVGRSAGE